MTDLEGIVDIPLKLSVKNIQYCTVSVQGQQR